MKVSVSNINTYEYCPRMIYLRNVKKIKAKPTPQMIRGLVGHAVRKEVSLRQAKFFEKAADVSRVDQALKAELELILTEFPYIYHSMLKDIRYQDYISEIKSEVEAEIDIMASQMKSILDDIGLKACIKQVTPWKVEYNVRSDKLNLTGRVDKIMKDETIIPVEIKTGTPADGVWLGNRIQLCAYAMLLEEDLGQDIEYGLVEYVKNYEKKQVVTSQSLRRRVLSNRDEITSILDGFEPEPLGQANKCTACSFSQDCDKT